jgi:hypothetical protein
MISLTESWMADIYPDLDNVKEICDEEVREYERCLELLVEESARAESQFNPAPTR